MTFENLLFSAGGGALLGFISGWALKRIIKIAMVIVGAFVLGLVYLSYKGLIDVHWGAVANQTQSAAYNATTAILNTVNNTARTLCRTSSTV